MRGLSLLALGAVGVAAVVVVTQDPERSWAVAVVIVALAVAAGAFVTMVQLRGATGGRRAAPRRGIAVRRGIEIAAIAALLLWLRAIDGLSILTGAFVVGGFLVAEAILSAQPRSSR